MPTTRRKRHRILALAAAVAVAVLVAVVVAAVVVWLRQPDSQPTAVPPSIVPPSTTSPGQTNGQRKPRPDFQDASCPDVELLTIPGTWESSLQLDPLNPIQFPAALLLNVTNPIRAAFGTDRLGEWTVPYTAQFHNPFAADKQMSYNDSRAEGTKAAVDAPHRDERQVPADQLRDHRVLAGRRDRRRHRQRHRQRPRAHRRRTWCSA